MKVSSNVVLVLGCLLVYSILISSCSNEINPGEIGVSSVHESSANNSSANGSSVYESSENVESFESVSSFVSSPSEEGESSVVQGSSSITNSSVERSSDDDEVSSDQRSSSVLISSESQSSSIELTLSSSETVWGVQMYTFRTDLDERFKETLQYIKDSGYDQIELAGYYGNTAETFYEWGQEIGVDFISTHHLTGPLRDSLPELMASANTLKASFMVLAWLAPTERETIEQYRALAQELNVWGATLKENGLTMVYHNHEFEFETIDGEIPYEVLMADTDPDLVSFQLDVAWAYKSGIDPLKYYSHAPERFPLFHLKDLDAPGAETVLDLGEGNIDYPTILPALLANPNQYYFIEHDHTLDPHETIKTNMTYLNSLGL
ncbi:MAG: sugar phosphate isomerase/epimerase [Fibrobacterales bacterium]